MTNLEVLLQSLLWASVPTTKLRVSHQHEVRHVKSVVGMRGAHTESGVLASCVNGGEEAPSVASFGEGLFCAGELLPLVV